MNASTDLERSLAGYYATEAPGRAPEWVLQEALATIEITSQRRARIRVPWRFPNMNTYAKVAVAAVVVVAVGAVGLAVLRPGPAGPGGVTPPSPSGSASPSPSPSVVTYVPPNLTNTFTSDIHGISLAYPEGWEATAATEPWTTSNAPPFEDPAGDVMYDPARAQPDHIFVTVASQPLDGTSLGVWSQGAFGAEGCRDGQEPVTVDGFDGLFGGNCGIVLTAAGDRGYVIRVYVSGDEEWGDFYFLEWLVDEILPTVDLRPEDAIDPPPSAAPSGSAAP